MLPTGTADVKRFGTLLWSMGRNKKKLGGGDVSVEGMGQCRPNAGLFVCASCLAAWILPSTMAKYKGKEVHVIRNGDTNHGVNKRKISLDIVNLEIRTCCVFTSVYVCHN